MNNPYNKVFRYPTEGQSSVNYDIPCGQLGKVVGSAVSGQNDIYIPCDLKFPQVVDLTPLNAAGKVAQGTGTQFNSLTLVTGATVSAVTNLDFATNTAVVIGEVQNDASNNQYICVVDVSSNDVSHAALASAWNNVSDRFQALDPEGGFIKLTITNVSGSKPAFNYLITGYK